MITVVWLRPSSKRTSGYRSANECTKSRFPACVQLTGGDADIKIRAAVERTIRDAGSARHCSASSSSSGGVVQAPQFDRRMHLSSRRLSHQVARRRRHQTRRHIPFQARNDRHKHFGCIRLQRQPASHVGVSLTPWTRSSRR
jgi:hypothetical protein